MQALPAFRCIAPVAAGLLAVSWGAMSLAETSTPTATTATYGAWTLGCAMVQPAGDATAGGAKAVRVCQMTTQLNLKGQDGQLRPLLQVSVGTPPGAKTARLALQVPTDVALREGVSISLDQPAAEGADPAAAKPQTPVLTLSYLTCTPQGCVADADAGAEVFDALNGQKAANVTFTSLQGGQKIVVPVSLDGFADAFAALKTAGK